VEAIVKTSPTKPVGIATFSSLNVGCFFCLAFFTILLTSSSSGLLLACAEAAN